MGVRTVAWSLAAVALLLAGGWALLRPPSGLATRNAPSSVQESDPALAAEVKPTEPGSPAAPGEESETRALQRFVEHLEAMLKPRDGDDPDRLVLRVPEHLQDASEGEKRAYLKELLYHGEAMVRYTRDQHAGWEEEALRDPELAAELVQRRKETDAAVQALTDLRARLVTEGVLGDAGL